MQALEQCDGFIQGRLFIKFNPQHALLKIPVMYNANIFYGNICLGEQCGKCSNGSGFVGDVHITCKYFLNRSFWQVGKRIAVFFGCGKQVIRKSFLPGADGSVDCLQ